MIRKPSIGMMSHTRVWSSPPLCGEVRTSFIQNTRSLMRRPHLMPILCRQLTVSHSREQEKTVVNMCSEYTCCQQASWRKRTGTWQVQVSHARLPAVHTPAESVHSRFLNLRDTCRETKPAGKSRWLSTPERSRENEPLWEEVVS